MKYVLRLSRAAVGLVHKLHLAALRAHVKKARGAYEAAMVVSDRASVLVRAAINWQEEADKREGEAFDSFRNTQAAAEEEGRLYDRSFCA